MKKTLLFCFVTFFLGVLAANADDISGKYYGDLTVTGVPAEPVKANIYVSVETGGTYTLSVKNFEFNTIPVGDLNVTGVTRTNEDGVVQLAKEGSSAGPAELGFPTLIYLDSAAIENGELYLKLTVKTADETPLVVVEFDGTLQTTKMNSTIDNSLSIYFSNDVITLNGLDNENYTIYSINGAAIQNGKVQNGQIEINSITTGSYILSVNNRTAKFVK